MQTSVLALTKTANFEGIKTKRELKPLLKWAGGKRWLLPYLKYLYQPHSEKRLVEPFSGGLAITLGLCPESALLNDINTHLINFYIWVKNKAEFNLKMQNEEKFYYELRTKFNNSTLEGKESTDEAAQQFYYLNRTCFNGLCRFNSKGGYNVPFGHYKLINYEKDLKEHQSVFSNWKFSNKDFEGLQLRKDDFIYADPPYDVQFTKYSKEDFKWEDQVRLVEWLAKHTGPVVLSNQATDRIVKLYKQHGFKLQFFDAPRMISCDGNRAKVKEVLATRGI